MNLKELRLKIFHGSIARRLLIRAFMLAFVLSIAPFLQMLSGSDSGLRMLNSLGPDNCVLESESSFSSPFLYAGSYLFSSLLGSVGSDQCEQDANLTLSVVRELMGMQMLTYGAKALYVGEGSASAVAALRDFGISNVCGVYRHPFFSLKQKKLVYELEYEDNSFDFVLSRDLDKVSVPALLVLEIERVLRPGGIGAMLVGMSGSEPNSLIRSATPVSSLLKASSVVHVGYLNEFTLVVFKKKLENVTHFEQYHLPADCPTITNNKAFLEYVEPLVAEKPSAFEKGIAYLPNFTDVSTRRRLVYIDIGAGEHLNSNVTSWFLPYYPVDHKAFNVYFVDYNTSVMLSYVKNPGITFVYHPGLAGNKATATAGNKAKANPDVDDLDPLVEDEGFDFLLWFKETVQYADFVVLKMSAGAVELKFLSELFESGTICFVDELFLRCSDDVDGKGVVREDCMDLFKGLRSSGVYVHQWWGR